MLAEASIDENPLGVSADPARAFDTDRDCRPAVDMDIARRNPALPPSQEEMVGVDIPDCSR
jgi:hypothetical protein